MGELIEWPEVITEGSDLEDCRRMLEDALHEMITAYHDSDKEIPVARTVLTEPLAVEV